MKKLLVGSMFAGTLMAAPAAFAADEEGWSGEVELGFNRSTGNTETDNLLGRAIVHKNFLKWRNDLKLEIIRSSEDSVRTKESLLLELQSNRDFGKRYYAFGNLRYIDDKFGGFRTQTTLSGGIGWNVIKEEGIP